MNFSHLFTKRVLIQAVLISIIYFMLTIYMMNFDLARDTLFGSYNLSYKINLLWALIGGIWTSMTTLSLFVIFLIAILTGINISLLTEKVALLKSTGKVQFFAGGGSLLGVVGSGCAACGIPALSLLGLSGSLIYFPFRGIEIGIAALLLLVLSFYFLTRFGNTVKMCEVKN